MPEMPDNNWRFRNDDCRLSIQLGNDGAAHLANVLLHCPAGFRLPDRPPPPDWAALVALVQEQSGNDACVAKFFLERRRLAETEKALDTVERDLARTDLSLRDAKATLAGETLGKAVMKAARETASLQARKEALETALATLRPQFELAKDAAERQVNRIAEMVRRGLKASIRDENLICDELLKKMAPLLTELVASRSAIDTYRPSLYELQERARATLLSDEAWASPASSPPAVSQEAADQPQRFVCLHAGVGRLQRGRVFGVNDLPPGANCEDLLSAGAIRHATKEEASREHVTIPEEPARHNVRAR